MAWNDCDLWLLRTGRGQIDTPMGLLDLVPGSCLVMRGGEPYTFHADLSRPFTHYWLHFSVLDERDRAIPPADLPEPARYRVLRQPGLMEQLISRTIRAKEAKDMHQARVWLAAALTELVRLDHESKQQRQLTEQESRLQSICQQIDRNPQFPWSVGELAAEYCASRTQFFRAFRAFTGRSPQKYIIETRMKRARGLLTESANDITWVATQCGFRDIFYFSRLFKQYHDLSPTSYRRQKT